MSRVLFVEPPLTGHVNPTVSVARALASRGHEVAWVGHPGAVRPRLPDGATLFALSEDVPRAIAVDVTARSQIVRGAAALKFLWEDFFVLLARSMRPGVAAAVDGFRPDVLCVDQQTIAGALVARARGLPWATLATTSAGVVDPLAGLPQVQRWLRDVIAELEREAGLTVSDHGALSPHRVIAFTTAALVGPAENFPPHYRFVGPATHERPEPAAFPWDQLIDRPRVLVSMGTVNADASERFYRTAVAALAELPVQAIVAAPPERVGVVAAPTIVRAFLPQLAVLAKVDAVICHAGHNTTCEALARGLPLVVAPIKDDQPIVADQVVAAGAALRVKFGRVQVAELRDAVQRVLTEPGFRAAASTIAASFVAAGGAAAAALAVEDLL